MYVFDQILLSLFWLFLLSSESIKQSGRKLKIILGWVCVCVRVYFGLLVLSSAEKSMCMVSMRPEKTVIVYRISYWLCWKFDEITFCLLNEWMCMYQHGYLKSQLSHYIQSLFVTSHHPPPFAFIFRSCGHLLFFLSFSMKRFQCLEEFQLRLILNMGVRLDGIIVAASLSKFDSV